MHLRGRLAGLFKVKGLRVSLAFLAIFFLEWQCHMCSIRRAFALLGYLFLLTAPAGQPLSFLLRHSFPTLIDAMQSARLEHFGSLLGEYDIVCLQELTVLLGRDSFVSELRRLGARHGLTHFCTSGRWAVFPATYAASGLGFMSRYPIIKAKPFHFSAQSWFEWSLIQRGALMVELESPSGRISVLNVHTTAGMEVIENGVGVRKDQHMNNPIGLEQLLEVLDDFEDFSKSATHRVFCGDFNLTKGSHAFDIVSRRAQSLGLKDCFPDSPPTFGCTDDPQEVLLTPEASRCQPKVLDHVFSNRIPAAAFVNKLEAPEDLLSKFQQVSDHRAIAVRWC